MICKCKSDNHRNKNNDIFSNFNEQGRVLLPFNLHELFTTLSSTQKKS